MSPRSSEETAVGVPRVAPSEPPAPAGPSSPGAEGPPEPPVLQLNPPQFSQLLLRRSPGGIQLPPLWSRGARTSMEHIPAPLPLRSACPLLRGGGGQRLGLPRPRTRLEIPSLSRFQQERGGTPPPSQAVMEAMAGHTDPAQPPEGPAARQSLSEGGVGGPARGAFPSLPGRPSETSCWGEEEEGGRTPGQRGTAVGTPPSGSCRAPTTCWNTQTPFLRRSLGRCRALANGPNWGPSSLRFRRPPGAASLGGFQPLGSRVTPSRETEPPPPSSPSPPTPQIPQRGGGMEPGAPLTPVWALSRYCGAAPGSGGGSINIPGRSGAARPSRSG